MADLKKKKTKVLSINKNSNEFSLQEQKLKALQDAIDNGLYKITADDIAKAYLHGPIKREEIREVKIESEKTTKSDLKSISVSKINK